MSTTVRRLPGDTTAILLLCGHFGGNEREAKPLSLTEYNKLAAWLHRENLRPEDLLTREGESRLDLFANDNVSPARVRRLLDRGMELSFAVEEWSREGIWVLSRGDDAYPTKLRKRLREAAPPLLFGVGDRGLLESPSLGIVGSRAANDRALDFARRLGHQCSSEGITVVSGGARGVDQEAMAAALESGGSVVAVLAEGVAKHAVAKSNRRMIHDDRLVLVSPYHPKARWTTGNAMGRNKQIYGFSDGTIVISSGTEGGTWSGAMEDLKHKWVPLLVREGEGVSEGNLKLIKLGGIPISDSAFGGRLSIRALLQRLDERGFSSGDLFSSPVPITHRAERSSGPKQSSLAGEEKVSPASGEEATLYTPRDKVEHGDKTSPKVAEPALTNESQKPADGVDLFSVVWPHIAPVFEKEISDKDLNEVANVLDIQVGQLRRWIKQAVNSNLVEKKTDPVRYKAQ